MKRFKGFASQRSKMESPKVSAGFSFASLLASANFRRRGLLAGFFVSLTLFIPLIASASNLTMASVFDGTGLAKVSLAVFIVYLIRLFLAFLGFLAVVFIMYGGYVWMSAGGDSGKIEKAKLIIKNTVIGLVIIFSAYAIASFIMAFLTGSTGPGSGTNYTPGGNGDWGRSGIGAGPIQSVYPRPNQVNVPINTRIAVTFKEDIDPASICTLTGGKNYCAGDVMKNVEICEIDPAVNTADCLATSKFTVASFAASTISQASSTDFKTFVISAATFLGDADTVNRTFKVVLKTDIEAKATNASIFSGFRANSYTWSFKTNGILDLDPPQVAKLGIYPNPDSQADGYQADVTATAGEVILTFNNNPSASLEEPMKLDNTNYLGGKLTNFAVTNTGGSVAPAFKLYMSSDSGFSIKSGPAVDLIFTVQGDQARFNNFASVASAFSINFVACTASPNDKACLPIISKIKIDTGVGFYFQTNGGDLPQASQWKVTVTPAKIGATFTILNGTAATNYIFAAAGTASKITKTVAAATGQGTVSTDYYTIIVGGTKEATAANLIAAVNTNSGSIVIASAGLTADSVKVMPKLAGTNVLSLNEDLSFIDSTGSLAGTAKPSVRVVNPLGSKPDPYNNSVFRVTFNKPINPIDIEKYVTITIAGVPVVASTTVSNNYQTVELVGTIPCGLNNCGQQIYCWQSPTTGPNDVSIAAEINVEASSLKTCSGVDQNSAGNEWCKSFGGTCTAGSRCKSGDQYYPQGAVTTDGITDMSNNSFNGNFNTVTTAAGYKVGNAEGKSGSGTGHSGLNPYNANNHTDLKNVFDYAADSGTGDSFLWSFFISTQIDKSAPLLTKVVPTGDSSLGSKTGESFRDPVNFVFNTLMRSSTAKPGWGYGIDKNDPAWQIRYLVLKTLTSGANPVGYWTAINDLDGMTTQGVGDGTADFSSVSVNHNPFDQSVSYSPLAGSGLQSITQNCYIPGNGPTAATGDCNYSGSGDATQGCVTDLDIDPDKRVTSTNPASYGYLNCKDIDGAVECNSGANDNDKTCKIHTGKDNTTATPNGSWVITKDFPKVISPFNGPATAGRTGCCFGACK